MKRALALAAVFLGLAAGCATNPLVLSPRVEATLRAAPLGFEVQKVRAGTHWSANYGQGMDVSVWVTRPPGDYARTLDLELRLAAEVLAALARDELSVRWDFTEVRLFCDFGSVSPGARRVVGVVDVLVRREALQTLRARRAGATEFPRHWVLLGGYKDQPDSAELLQW